MGKTLLFFFALGLGNFAFGASPLSAERTQIYYEAIITQSALISKISVFVENGQYSIEIDGEIERVAVWVGALKIIPKNTDFSIVLSSPGGLVDDTIAIINHVRNKCHSPFTPESQNKCTITTVVKDNKTCSSACTFVFAAGDVRAASGDGKFGFHGAGTFEDFVGYVIAPVETSTMPYFISPVADQAWVSSLTEKGVFDKAEVSLFTRKDMMGTDFVTKWL